MSREDEQLKFKAYAAIGMGLAALIFIIFARMYSDAPLVSLDSQPLANDRYYLDETHYNKVKK